MKTKNKKNKSIHISVSTFLTSEVAIVRELIESAQQKIVDLRVSVPKKP